MTNARLSWSEKKDIDRLVRLLQGGGVAIASTDTVIGFLAPADKQGFERLNMLKKRQNLPYLLLIGSLDRLPLFTDQILVPNLQKLIKSCWPGPVTLLFKAKQSLPEWLKGPHGTIALRIPQHQGLLGLLSSFDGLFSTSANRHGQPVPLQVSDVDPALLQLVTAVISDQKEESEQQQASTILDCTQDNIKVVRAGAYPIDQLEAIYGQPFIKPLT